MKTAILDVAPETPGEELRYESALRAVHVHERAKSFRTVAIVVVFAITTARICLAHPLACRKAWSIRRSSTAFASWRHCLPSASNGRPVFNGKTACRLTLDT